MVGGRDVPLAGSCRCVLDSMERYADADHDGRPDRGGRRPSADLMAESSSERAAGSGATRVQHRSTVPEHVTMVERLIEELGAVAASGTPLTPEVVTRAIGMLTSLPAGRPAEVFMTNILSSRGRTIRPKTVGQKHYVDT